MSRSDDEIHLSKCLELIEARLDRGLRQGWSNYDFEQLSAGIHATTHVRLSVTTLKRIFGRVKYESFPTHTTLNALARYAGYTDWRNFTQRQASPPPELQEEAAVPMETVPHAAVGRRRGSAGALMWAAIAIPLLLVVYLLIASREKQHIDSEKFSFRADKAFDVGLPNSVVFHYDATAATTDSVFIVQTWDIRRKARVSVNQRAHSAIYYYPGYFRTKLIVGNKVVKTHDLQIASGGWLCLAENEPQPVYFRKEECEQGDSVMVGIPVLQKYNLALHPDPPRIRLFHQGDMGELMNDNFTFETQLKNPFKEGSNACQHVEVLIQCKDDIIIIPLVARECTGELRLYAAGYSINSRNADLSGFGCDLNDWVTLRLVTRNRHMQLFVDGKEAYALDFPNEPTGIVGVQFRFRGPGGVRATRFESGETVYALK